MMSSDLRMLELMMLVLIFTFPISDISKISQLLNQLKNNLNLMELCPIISLDILWYSETNWFLQVVMDRGILI